jgi:hypothetical protein
MKKTNLLWAAAIGGGLYWASKQPGGISGTWDRVSGKLKEIQDSPDPLGTIKQQLNVARFGNSSSNALDSNDLYVPASGLNAPPPMEGPAPGSVSVSSL